MPLPLMVRIDDDLAKRLRDEANRSHAPMNRIINDALKARYEAGVDTSGAPRKDPHIVATFGDLLQQVRDALEDRQHQDNETDYRAKSEAFERLLFDSIAAIMIAMDPSLNSTYSAASPSPRTFSQLKETHA